MCVLIAADTGQPVEEARSRRVVVVGTLPESFKPRRGFHSGLHRASLPYLTFGFAEPALEAKMGHPGWAPPGSCHPAAIGSRARGQGSGTTAPF